VTADSVKKRRLPLLGRDTVLAVAVPEGGTPADTLFEAARDIAETVTRLALEHSMARGEPPSCRAGCSACCTQLVPISAIEARRLLRLVRSMPEEQARATRKRFADVVHRFEKAGLLDRAAPRGRANLTVQPTANESLWQTVSRRYRELGIACPFLVRGMCSVYDDRPLVCREFYVSTPAEYCTSRRADVRGLPRPVRMSEVLADAENTLSGGEQLLIPLFLALEWAEVHADVLDPSLDSEHVVEVLLDCIEVLA